MSNKWEFPRRAMWLGIQNTENQAFSAGPKYLATYQISEKFQELSCDLKYKTLKPKYVYS